MITCWVCHLLLWSGVGFLLLVMAPKHQYVEYAYEHRDEVRN